jgi:hypothetical protein
MQVTSNVIVQRPHSTQPKASTVKDCLHLDKLSVHRVNPHPDLTHREMGSDFGQSPPVRVRSMIPEATPYWVFQNQNIHGDFLRTHNAVVMRSHITELAMLARR